jgi:hypothetical protein
MHEILDELLVLEEGHEVVGTCCKSTASAKVK